MAVSTVRDKSQSITRRTLKGPHGRRLAMPSSPTSFWVRGLFFRRIPPFRTGINRITQDSLGGKQTANSGASGKNIPANVGDVRDVGLVPGSGRSPGGGQTTHSSSFAWRIPRIEPGKPWSTLSQRVRHDWINLAHMHADGKWVSSLSPPQIFAYNQKE